MTLKDRIKGLFKRGKPTLAKIVGTFNGYCPGCNDHIGAYIMKKPLGKQLVTCGCGLTFEVKDDA